LIVGVLGSFNQVSVKILLAFSSIHHIGWIVLGIIVEEIIWVIYLFIYFFMLYPLIIYLYNYNVDNIISLIKIKFKLVFIGLLIRISGIPPFLGFFLKWISFYFILSYRYFFIGFMVVISVFIIFIYIRFIYKMLIGLGDEFSWTVQSNLIYRIIGVDIFVIIGLLFGLIIGVIMVAWYIKIIILLIFKVKNVNLIWIYNSSSNDFIVIFKFAI